MVKKMIGKDLRHWLIPEFTLVGFHLALQVSDGVKSLIHTHNPVSTEKKANDVFLSLLY